MDVHAEYVLKCNAAAKWLNTPQPITGIPKEFLDGSFAITTTITGLCNPSPISVSQSQQLSKSQQQPIQKSTKVNKRKRSSSCLSSSTNTTKSEKHSFKTPYWDDEEPLSRLHRNYPSLSTISKGQQQPDRSLLFIPVELFDQFIFGVIYGCPIPPPCGVTSQSWTPVVTRFVLDISRKCCLMFSYLEQGSIVVICDSFDELGDHQVEAIFFESTPLIGVFPRGIKGRMRIFEKRDCPQCSIVYRACRCEQTHRVSSIVKARQLRTPILPPGVPTPCSDSSLPTDESISPHLVRTYPHWAQSLEEYIWSRTGSYSIRVDYNPPVIPNQQQKPCTIFFRASVASDTRPSIETMIRKMLFERGVSELKPPVTDVRWESSHTISVKDDNTLVHEEPNEFIIDLHKLPGFQQDYLLKAPSNIVSEAHVREELVRTEAERLANRARVAAPVIPTWASGGTAVFRHILSDCAPELEGLYRAQPELNSEHPHSSLEVRPIVQENSSTGIRQDNGNVAQTTNQIGNISGVNTNLEHQSERKETPQPGNSSRNDNEQQRRRWNRRTYETSGTITDSNGRNVKYWTSW